MIIIYTYVYSHNIDAITTAVLYLVLIFVSIIMNSVYSCTDIFYIVTYIDRSGLYCASKNLFTTFSIITPYCVIAGIHMHTSYNH